MEQLMFTEIEFPKTIPDSALQPELDPAKFQRVTRFVPEPKPFNVDSEADAQFANLPPGYHVAMRDVRPTLDGQGVVEHMLLRSEEHTSELQSLMRITYAVFCLKTQ